MSKVLITGGSGFIGSILAKTLLERGYSVRVFDLIDFKERPSTIEFVQGDIRNKEDIRRAFSDILEVYHCVALVPLSKAGKKYWEVNVEGTRNLLEVCREYPIKRLVHLSSCAIFGSPQCPITHDTPCKPIEEYGRAKLAGEELVGEYMKEGRVATIIRPRTVVGNFRLGIFHILFEWVKENRNIYIIGKGDNLFQFIHVDDLIDAMIRSAEAGVSGVFNIGSDRFHTLREDLVEFIRQVGSSSRVVSLPKEITVFTLRILDWLHLSPLAPWHYLAYHIPLYFDLTEEMKILHWKPKYSNVEMLVSAYQWFFAHRDVLERGSASLASTHHAVPKQKILRLLKWFS